MNYCKQLQELEQRSTITSLFSNYLGTGNNDDDLNLYKNMNQRKQFFLLRKQYDYRMKQLAQISFNQRVKIAKFDHFLESILK